MRSHLFWRCVGLVFIGIVTPSGGLLMGQVPYPCPSPAPVENTFDVPTMDILTPTATFWIGYAVFNGAQGATFGNYVPTDASPIDMTGYFVWVSPEIGVSCTEDMFPEGSVIYITWTGYLGGFAERMWGPADDDSGGVGGDGTGQTCYDLYVNDDYAGTYCTEDDV